jgi:hypothetical protein
MTHDWAAFDFDKIDVLFCDRLQSLMQSAWLMQQENHQ